MNGFFVQNKLFWALLNKCKMCDNNVIIVFLNSEAISTGRYVRLSVVVSACLLDYFE